MPSKRFTSSFILTALCFLVFVQSCDETTVEQSIHPLTQFESDRGNWKWLYVDGMVCRDGSETGIGVRLGEDKKRWVIYLQGGGACFTEETCSSNREDYGEGDFANATQQEFYNKGILNHQNEKNPVQDWNFVFVPYCTGDVFSGTNESSYGLGLENPQKFVGAYNMETLWNFLKPYMESNDVEEILLTGVSAGGFGTHLSYFSLKERLPDVKTHVINDSGPLMSDPELFPVCLQLGFQFIYDLPVPSGFLFCCQPAYGLADIYTLSSRYWPTDNFALVSYTEDNTIRYFFGPGQNTCTGGNVSGEMFHDGLKHLRENVMKPTGKWSTFYISGNEHTTFQSDAKFYTLDVQGVKLYEFVGDVMNGTVQHLEEL